MDETLLIPIFAGVAVVTLIGGVGLVMSKSSGRWPSSGSTT